MVAVFEVLAELNRRRILETLRGGECAVNDVVDRLHMSQPNVSRHLKVLRDAGLVTVRGDAQRRVYSLRAEPLTELDAWLNTFRPFWEDKLDALARHLEDDAKA